MLMYRKNASGSNTIKNERAKIRAELPKENTVIINDEDVDHKQMIKHNTERPIHYLEQNGID